MSTFGARRYRKLTRHSSITVRTPILSVANAGFRGMAAFLKQGCQPLMPTFRREAVVIRVRSNDRFRVNATQGRNGQDRAQC